MEEKKAYCDAGLLKGTSVIMVIFGILETVLFFFVLGVLLTANITTADIFSGSREILGAGLLLAAAISELVCGVIGRRSVKTGGGATACVVLGFLCLALTTTSLIVMASKADVLTLLTLILSAVLPVFYIIGAFQAAAGQNAGAGGEEQQAPGDDNPG